MNLKHWIVVGATALALAACGSPAAQSTAPTAGTSATNAPATANTAPAAGAGATTAPAAGATTTGAAASGDPKQVVARVGEITLTRGDLDVRIKRIQDGIKANVGGQPAPSNLEVEKSLVDLFLNQVLTLNVANQRNVAISDKEVDDQITQIDKSITAQGGTLAAAVTGQLGYADTKAPEFRQLISSIVARQKIGQTLVTTATVEQELRTTLETQAKEQVEKADVQHILFLAKTPADEAGAKAKAEDVIKRLAKGEDFDALAKQLSEDPGSKDNGGRYEGATAFERGQLDPAFEKAAFDDLKVGETTKEPVKSQFGYHVIRVNKREKGPKFTPGQITAQLAQQVPQQVQQRQGEEFQKLVDAEKAKAKTAGTLQEPAYPEPTPAAPGALPGDVAPAEPTSGADSAPTAQP